MHEPSLSELAASLRDGSLTSRDLSERAIARHRPELGAYRQWEPKRALSQAQLSDAAFAAGRDLGPLQGLPVSIKDLFGVPGYDTYAGSPKALPARFAQAGPVVARALAQLAVVMGKTHTVEFAFGGIGTNPHWGAPKNPWDETRVTGGSSSGAAASLGEGSALWALGSDTAGSVRIPAAWTGNVGLKTTHGRWSIDGVVPLSPSLDTVGVLARTARDAAFVFQALDGASIAPLTLDRLTLGVPEQFFFEACSPGVAESVRDTIAELERAGARVRTFELPGTDELTRLFRQGGTQAVDLARFLARELPDWLPTLDERVRDRMRDASSLPAVEYLARLEAIEAATRQAAEPWPVDLVVMPAVANTPPRIDDLSDVESYRDQNLLALRNTSIISCLGLCAVSVPVALDAAGMPVGLMLAARAGQDASLLASAVAVEAVIGTRADRLGEP